MKNLILISATIYSIAFFLAWFISISNTESIETTQNIIGNLNDETKFNNFIFILRNNLFVTTLYICGALTFGLFSLVILFWNGFIFGSVIKSSIGVLTTNEILLATLPHSSEVLSMIFASALGMYLGVEFFKYSFFDGYKFKIKTKYIYTWLIVIYSIVFISAFLESYVSMY